jgi:hypothetical protein
VLLLLWSVLLCQILQHQQPTLMQLQVMCQQFAAAAPGAAALASLLACALLLLLLQLLLAACSDPACLLLVAHQLSCGYHWMPCTSWFALPAAWPAATGEQKFNVCQRCA